MYLTIPLRRLWRPVAVLSGGVSLILALGAAASPDAVAATPVIAGAHTAASGGTWGDAQEVPGSAALNKAGNAEIEAVSCASAGNCSAGGYYGSKSGKPFDKTQAFVVNEVNGTWGTAEAIAGTPGVSNVGDVGITSLSCASAGNCSAGGNYRDKSGHWQAFVVNEVNLKWGAAQEVAGALNTHGNAQTLAMSCASAGNCSAGGFYVGRSGQQAFVVNEVNLKWGVAQEVPGTAALNKSGNAQTLAVSCASAGNCSAGGYYNYTHADEQAFVVNEVNGTWGTAREVPGSAAVNTGNAALISVSCASVGNCSADGGYTDKSGNDQAFVVNEVNGKWGAAEEVPGMGKLNAGGLATAQTVSCVSAGNCSAGGSYTEKSGREQAFVVGEVNGKWGTAEEVAAALNTEGNATVLSVSCASAGNCSAGGLYSIPSGNPSLPYSSEAFVINEVNGKWGTAEQVPGMKKLNTGKGAAVSSVSCASAGNCSAGGVYSAGKDHNGEAFVVNET